MLTTDDLREKAKSGEIDTVLVCFPDLFGRLLGKRASVHFFLESVIEETHACDYLLACDMDMEPVPGYAAASWDQGYGDFVLRPDMNTLRQCSWLEGTALVLADVTDEEGNDLPHAPRSVLKRQLARLDAQGWRAMMGSELEFYVFHDDYRTARDNDYKGLEHAGWYIEDYHIFQTSKEEPLIRAIRNHMDASGVPVEVSKGEFGPGQEEINLKFAEALEMADRHTIYKNAAKEIGHLHGYSLTFMAKYAFEHAGSSFHLHSSLWDKENGTALFPDETDTQGMSGLFKHYLAGQLALFREMTLFCAPFVNSFKRYQAASFAPTKAAWSFDNRTAGFRIIGHGKGLRVENRIPGADANPYLAYAATIAAGLYGIENKLELPEAFSGNAYEASDVPDVPKTLREAVAALDNSRVMRDALGDDVVDHYVHTGRWEQYEYDRRVTDWERERLFERC